jgi:hypothetical protein
MNYFNLKATDHHNQIVIFLMRLFKVAAGKPIWATVHSSRVVQERPAEIFRRFFSSFIGKGRPQVPLRALFQISNRYRINHPFNIDTITGESRMPCICKEIF